MRHRGYLPVKERQARSRLAQLLHQKSLSLAPWSPCPEYVARPDANAAEGNSTPDFIWPSE